MKLKFILLTAIWIVPSASLAQSVSKRLAYLGGMGGVATLSGDASAVITPTSASTSLFDPKNGAAAEAFVGIHLFEYVSFEANYVWNRNNAALVSNSEAGSAINFYRVPESITQNTILGNVLVYFRKRQSRIRPFLAEGGGAVFQRSRISGGAIVVGNPVLPPPMSSHTSVALRTLVGIDLRLRGPWYFRYTFGETITRNTLGDQVSPAEHRIPKNFQSLFGIVFRP